MKPLATQFFKKGFGHQQLHRKGMVAMFQRWKEGIRPHFEVVVIGSHNGFKIPGTETITPPAETYPSSEQWGSKGFTFNDEDAALAKFHKLASTPAKQN